MTMVMTMVMMMMMMMMMTTTTTAAAAVVVVVVVVVVVRDYVNSRSTRLKKKINISVGNHFEITNLWLQFKKYYLFENCLNKYYKVFAHNVDTHVNDT